MYRYASIHELRYVFLFFSLLRGPKRNDTTVAMSVLSTQIWFLIPFTSQKKKKNNNQKLVFPAAMTDSRQYMR